MIAALQAYDALNFLGSIPWRVNKQALAALSAAWAKGGDIGGLIPRTLAPSPMRCRLTMVLRHHPYNLTIQVNPVCSSNGIGQLCAQNLRGTTGMSTDMTLPYPFISKTLEVFEKITIYVGVTLHLHEPANLQEAQGA